jgi:hypothetical protein
MEIKIMNAAELRSAIRQASRDLARLLDKADSCAPGSGPDLSEEDYAAINQDAGAILVRAAQLLMTAGYVDDDLLATVERVADAISDSAR